MNIQKHNDLDSFGLTSIAIPKAKNSSKGVSVEYVQDDKKRWFVLRATYQREDRAADALIEAGIYAYVAKKYVVHEQNGRKKRVLQSLIPSIFFAYLTPDLADLLVRNNRKGVQSPCPQLATFLTYYYNHFTTDIFGKNPPLTIQEAEMKNFILATATHDEDIIALDRTAERLISGEEVIIARGPFKGVYGHVIEDAGKKRVTVSLTGLGNYATTKIPVSYLKRLNK